MGSKLFLKELTKRSQNGLKYAQSHHFIGGKSNFCGLLEMVSTTVRAASPAPTYVPPAQLYRIVEYKKKHPHQTCQLTNEEYLLEWFAASHIPHKPQCCLPPCWLGLHTWHQDLWSWPRMVTTLPARSETNEDSIGLVKGMTRESWMPSSC